MSRQHAIAFLALLLSAAVAARAQALPQAPQEVPFDPYHAEKSLEIGTYYLKKGNYDAAIERFQAAARSKPNFARAYRLLGEAYEKKGDKAEAVNSYRNYLEILPSAQDAGKVRKRIEKLSRGLNRAARHPSG